MAMIRWEPVGELHSIQNEMNRLFNTFFDSPAQGARPGAMQRRWIPPMDLVETADEFVLRADLPGMSGDDVEISLEDNVLTISGERQAKQDAFNEGYYRIERGTGSFSRSLTLPEGVEAGAVRADFDRGVLEVRIPKPEQRKPRKVAIGVGDGAEQAKTIEGSEAAAT